MPDKAIKAILECINSESDTYGNRYWAFQYTDAETGKRVCGNISGGESNISALLRHMPETRTTDGMTNWDAVYYFRTEMKKREFRCRTKDWEYAGCPPEAIAQFIQSKLAEVEHV